jgi:hypothetical protein
MDLLPHFGDQGGKMQKSEEYEQGLQATVLDALGGEPLVGSGFETEDRELGFSIAEATVQEQR